MVLRLLVQPQGAEIARGNVDSGKIRPVTRYLSELSHSIFFGLGLPATTDQLGVGPSPFGRECLLLVDGLGLDALAKFGSDFPIFQQLENLPNLISHFPTTTATNLSSLGTGVLPGVHGMLGYTVRVPRSGEPGRLLNALKWDERVDPGIWQSTSTLFERGKAAGISVSHVAAKRYEGSGFTRAALRGADYLGTNYVEEMVALTAKALASTPSFVYLYVNNVDSAGHEKGVGSEKWLLALQSVSNLVSSLVERLPTGTRLWVTSDHGMINVGEKIILGVENTLMEEVTLVGGEPRARHIYLREGSLSDSLDRWRTTLGEKASVFSREEAINQGLFGSEVSLESSERMGDLIAIPHGEVILIDPSRIPQESSMVGHHGAMSEIEREIPLLTKTIS